jgi:hypothetical protein
MREASRSGKSAKVQVVTYFAWSVCMDLNPNGGLNHGKSGAINSHAIYVGRASINRVSLSNRIGCEWRCHLCH